MGSFSGSCTFTLSVGVPGPRVGEQKRTRDLQGCVPGPREFSEFLRSGFGRAVLSTRSAAPILLGKALFSVGRRLPRRI
jgi:hypothetical protein